MGAYSQTNMGVHPKTIKGMVALKLHLRVGGHDGLILKVEYRFAAGFTPKVAPAQKFAKGDGVLTRQPTKVMDEVKDFSVAHVLKW
jgi:hypothetical protein